MTRSANRRSSRDFSALDLGGECADEQSDGHNGVVDGLEQSKVLGGKSENLRSCTKNACPTSPIIPMASERLSPASRTAVRSSSNPGPAPLPPPNRGGGQQSTWCDLQRQQLRRLVGQSIGDIACPSPARLCGGDISNVRPGARPHVPPVGGRQITCGFKVFGDQRGVLIGGPRIALFDLGGQPAVQSGAVGLEL